MGVEITVSVYYGVAEPKKWMQTRRKKEETYHIQVCPNGHGSKKGINSPFCPQCGTKPEPVPKTRTVSVSAAEAYGEPRWEESCEGDEWEWLDNHPIIHDRGAMCGETEPLIFGYCLGSVDGKRGDDDVYLTNPTPEQQAALQTFLERVGWEGNPPTLFMVCSYS